MNLLVSSTERLFSQGLVSLAEEIFVLALLEKKEALHLSHSLSLPFSLSAAVIIDLYLSGLITFKDGRLSPDADPEQIQNVQMKRTLVKIQQVGKIKKLAYWVYLLGMKRKHITSEIILALVNKGILIEDGKHYLWPVQKQEHGLTVAMNAKYLLKREIRDTIFGQSAPDERLFAVLDLMDACDMLDHLFTNDEMVFARKKINTLKHEKHVTIEYLDLLEQMKDAVKYAVASAIMK